MIKASNLAEMLIDILGTKLDIGPSQILVLAGVVAIFKMATSIGQIFLNDPLAEKKNQWILLLLGVPNNILKNLRKFLRERHRFQDGVYDGCWKLKMPINWDLPCKKSLKISTLRLVFDFLYGY